MTKDISRRMIDLPKVESQFYKSAIHWATTNQDFTDMRDDFLYFIGCFLGKNRHNYQSRLFKIIKKSIIDKLIKDTASSLTKVQQAKLKITLERIGT